MSEGGEVVQGQKIDFSDNSRVRNFKKANKILPLARKREIDQMFELVNPQPGEIILEWGCGQGVLARRMAEEVGLGGKVIALDVNSSLLEEVNPEGREEIDTALIQDQVSLPIKEGSVDKVVTLAGFHHSPDKERSISEIERVLKDGGKLLIGDVENDTSVQEFFDTFVDKYCSTGHEHSFLDKEWATEIFGDREMDIEMWENREVPWKFQNRYQAAWFVQNIFDIRCEREKCFERVREVVGVCEEDKVKIEWNLFYMRAVK